MIGFKGRERADIGPIVLLVEGGPFLWVDHPAVLLGVAVEEGVVGSAFASGIFLGEHGGTNRVSFVGGGDFELIDMYLEMIDEGRGSDVFPVFRVSNLLFDVVEITRETAEKIISENIFRNFYSNVFHLHKRALDVGDKLLDVASIEGDIGEHIINSGLV
jgi:hypothetical protein